MGEHLSQPHRLIDEINNMTSRLRIYIVLQSEVLSDSVLVRPIKCENSTSFLGRHNGSATDLVDLSQPVLHRQIIHISIPESQMRKHRRSRIRTME